MPNEEYTTFEDVKSRLDQIVDAVSDDTLPLDEALALYEEAVGLGLRASDLLEENIEAQRAIDEVADETTEAAETDTVSAGATDNSVDVNSDEPVSA